VWQLLVRGQLRIGQGLEQGSGQLIGVPGGLDGGLHAGLELLDLGPGRVELRVRQAEDAFVDALGIELGVVDPEALALCKVQCQHVEAVVARHRQARPEHLHLGVTLEPLRHDQPA